MQKVDVYLETDSVYQGKNIQKMWICPLYSSAQRE